MRRSTVVVGVLVLVAVAAGAAAIVVVILRDGESNGALSRSEYINRVNAVCQEYNARLNRIPPPSSLGSPDAIAASIRRALPLVEARAEKARAIPPPKALEADVKRLFALSDRAIRKLRTARRAAEAGNLRGSAEALGQFLATGQQARQVGVSIGLSC